MEKHPDTIRVSYRPAAVLKVTGEDAEAFLQGQFTQELRATEHRAIAYGLWLNQKGKVLADSFVLRDGTAFWVVSLETKVSTICERLEAYIIADDVVLEDQTDRWAGWAVVGPEATGVLSAAGFALPEKSQWAPVGDGILFRGRRTGGEGWEWLLPASAEKPTALLTVEKGTGADLLRLRILAGIPAVPIDIGPGDLHNEGAIDASAISYTKGCYLGQEVMARLKSMGQVRRHLWLVPGTGSAQ